jgi:integrase/recombinase XerC
MSDLAESKRARGRGRAKVTRLQAPPQLGPDGEIGAFLDDLRRQDRAPLTILDYKRDLDLFKRWYEQANGEPMLARNVIDEDILDYKAYMRRERGFKHTTVNRRLCALRVFFKWAVTVHLCAENPTTNVRDVRGTKAPPKNLSHQDEKRVVHAVKRAGKPRDIAIVTLGLHCGLRTGDVVNLRLGDLDLHERKGTIHLRQGKGDKDRDVPANADVRAALRAWLAVRPAVPHDYVFVGRTGEPLGRDGVAYLYKCLRGKLGMDKLHHHMTRHTNAHNLLEQGAPLPVVQQLLGHESISTTAQYLTPSQEDLDKAARSLETEW